MRKDLHEGNRRSWNAATVAHNSHKRDQASFFRTGGSTLFPEEIALLGEIAGQRLVHLQCNAGQDSLSLAGLGAQVTGVDISDTAIEFARQLAGDAGMRAGFERADVYDWFEQARVDGRRFDIAFSSYGALCWLSDLDGWARGLAEVLEPGGRFVCVEFHPVAMIFDPQWQPKYPYFAHGEPLVWEDGVNDYVALSGEALAPSGNQPGVQDFRNPHPSYEFQWSLAEVVDALLRAGLRLRRLQEYPYANGWRGFDGMREAQGRRMYPPATMPSLPLMYGLVAERSA